MSARAWSFVAGLVGMGKHELAETLKLNPRTLQRRTTLYGEEAERILRVFHVFQETTAMCHGDRHDAQRWTNAPAVALGGHRPIEMLDTGVGYREVLNIIRAVNWGVYL
jgi:putative toxin-antitoxin system antitoxin component (TIGR02293 family)